MKCPFHKNGECHAWVLLILLMAFLSWAVPLFHWPLMHLLGIDPDDL